MAGAIATALFAGLVLAQASPPATPEPGPVLTAEPTTRFGEACLLAARRTLVFGYEFRLKDVEDRTVTGGRDVWIDYEAVRIDSGAVHEEAFGCLFVATDNPSQAVLEGAANNDRRLPPDALSVLNRELAEAGFQSPSP